jgi:hypothetical protein
MNIVVAVVISLVCGLAPWFGSFALLGQLVKRNPSLSAKKYSLPILVVSQIVMLIPAVFAVRYFIVHAPRSLPFDMGAFFVGVVIAQSMLRKRMTVLLNNGAPPVKR